MESSTHLVARQTVEVLGKDRFECEALAAQTNRMAAILAAAVEGGLDSVDTPGERLRIGRVEMDLGACDPAHWEESLAHGIRSRLPELIMAAIRHSEAERSDPAQAAILLLDEFARSGRLPWWCSASDSPQAAVQTLASEGCRAEAVRAVLGRPQAIERFVNQLTVHELLSLIELARPELAGHGPALFGAFAEMSGAENRAPVEAVALPASLWRAALEEAASSGPAEPALPMRSARPARDGRGQASILLAEYKEGVARRFGEVKGGQPGSEAGRRRDARQASEAPILNVSNEASAELAGAVAERSRAAGATGPAVAEMARRIAGIGDRLDQRFLADAKKALDSDTGLAGVVALLALLVEERAVSAAEAAEWSEELNAARSPAGEEEHDSVAVHTSGLVIAWPFLPAFFESLEMLEDGCFRDAASRHRAAAILHFLATGDGDCPEQDLPLAKILVGLGLETVHDRGEPLSPFETGSADALLDAILGHAPMLGKISRAGLREAFLIRPGALTTRDGHWLLRAERRGMDVLLDRLPWSFSCVQLPWMEAALQVEW
jgi:hypothetical protein